MRWLFLDNHLLKMNNHLPLQFTPPRISVSWMVCRTMTCICFGCSALPPRFSEFIYRCIATSKNILTCFSYDRIEINNLLEVFVQISKTSFGFCNNLGLRPRSLPNPTSVFDICTNTSNSLFISIPTNQTTNQPTITFSNSFDEENLIFYTLLFYQYLFSVINFINIKKRLSTFVYMNQNFLRLTLYSA